MTTKKYLSEKEMYDILMGSSSDEEDEGILGGSGEEDFSAGELDFEEGTSAVFANGENSESKDEDPTQHPPREKNKTDYEWEKVLTYIPTIHDFQELWLYG